MPKWPLALSCLCSGLFLSQQLMERSRGRQWALPSIHHQSWKQQVCQGLKAQETFLFSLGHSLRAVKLSSCCSLSPVQPPSAGPHTLSCHPWKRGQLSAVQSQAGGEGRSSAARAEQEPCWSNNSAGGHKEALCLKPHKNHSGLTSTGNNCLSPVAISLPCQWPRICWGILGEQSLHRVVCAWIEPWFQLAPKAWTHEGSNPGNPVDLIQQSASKVFLCLG